MKPKPGGARIKKHGFIGTQHSTVKGEESREREKRKEGSEGRGVGEEGRRAKKGGGGNFQARSFDSTYSGYRKRSAFR